MEFDFTSLAFGGEQHIVAWDRARIGNLKPEDQQNLLKVLDVFGKKSAVAQGLQTPVTDIHRLRTTDQRLYLYMYRQSAKTVVLGGLKVGTKRLYVRTITADLKEIEPMCVLDFYVHESCQRQGIGKALFEHFLNTEGCDPSCLAYDRPSPKLLAFLRKHYGIQDYVPQSNNYVVFNRYFELNPGAGVPSTGRSQGRLSSRGSVMSVHPLQGSRSTPLPPPSSSPLPAALGVHPAWAGSPALSAPTPCAVGPPAPMGNSPSFGRRWASSNFGSGAVQEGFGAATPPCGPADGEAGSYGRSRGDSLDVFSREHAGSGTGGRQPASWEGGGQADAAAAVAPLGSRGGYSSRPPWAVDDVSSQAGSSGRGTAARTPPPQERLGTSSSSSGGRGPLQTILSGGGAGRDGSNSGPHTRALQQQVAALQVGEGLSATGGGMDGGRKALNTPPPAPPPWGPAGTPATGSRLGSSGAEDAAAGRSAARIMAVAQRSGAGAADCLVW